MCAASPAVVEGPICQSFRPCASTPCAMHGRHVAPSAVQSMPVTAASATSILISPVKRSTKPGAEITPANSHCASVSAAGAGSVTVAAALVALAAPADVVATTRAVREPTDGMTKSADRTAEPSVSVSISTPSRRHSTTKLVNVPFPRLAVKAAVAVCPTA